MSEAKDPLAACGIRFRHAPSIVKIWRRVGPYPGLCCEKQGSSGMTGASSAAMSAPPGKSDLHLRHTSTPMSHTQSSRGKNPADTWMFCTCAKSPILAAWLPNPGSARNRRKDTEKALQGATPGPCLGEHPPTKGGGSDSEKSYSY